MSDRNQGSGARGQETAEIIPFPRRRRNRPKPAFLVGGAYLDRLAMERYIEERMTRVEDLTAEIREMVR